MDSNNVHFTIVDTAGRNPMGTKTCRMEEYSVCRKRDGKEIYWEHDGRMDDPKYAEKTVRKINSYIANGYFLGDNLIVSFESSGNVLSDRIIKSMISKYIS